MQNWVCANCAPAAIFAASAFGSQPGAGSIGLSAPPRKKSARPPILLPRRQLALVAQPARGFQQLPRIEIEHRLGVGLIAGRRIVAAQDQQIAHAGRGGGEQLALQRDAVAVTAGELQDRLDALPPPTSLPPSTEPRCGRAPAPSVMLTASAKPLSGIALASRSLRSARNRRRDFGGDDETAGGEFVFQCHGHPSRKIQWTWQAQE